MMVTIFTTQKVVFSSKIIENLKKNNRTFVFCVILIDFFTKLKFL